MNNDTLRLMAQFTVRARKLIGTIDLKKFNEDETYREGIFSQIDSQGDEELLILALTLRESLSKPAETSPPDEETKADADKPTKYVFGARG